MQIIVCKRDGFDFVSSVWNRPYLIHKTLSVSGQTGSLASRLAWNTSSSTAIYRLVVWSIKTPRNSRRLPRVSARGTCSNTVWAGNPATMSCSFRSNLQCDHTAFRRTTRLPATSRKSNSSVAATLTLPCDMQTYLAAFSRSCLLFDVKPTSIVKVGKSDIVVSLWPTRGCILKTGLLTPSYRRTYCDSSTSPRSTRE